MGYGGRPVTLPVERGEIMRGASATRWLFGLLLVGIGVLFLLDTTDTIDTENVWGLIWPAILVFLGASFLIRERGRSLVGLVLLLLGVGFFAQNAEWIKEGWIGRYWPVVVIVAGLAILVEATGVLRPRPTRMEGETAISGDEWLRSTAFMSGRKERVTSSAWKGGDVTAVMGGVELDLRETKPVSGGAVLDVTAVMGGVDVTVPRGWRVRITGTPLLGGFDDKTDPSAGDEAPVLEVRGVALMGGVDIKH